MAEAKTQPTRASVDAYIAGQGSSERRADCQALVSLMGRVTGEPATMWGTGIVGFGQYHCVYDSGHQGDACLAGFAARKGDLSLYVLAGFDQQADLLTRLGKRKTGKSCLYVKRLSDVDLGVLEEIVRRSVAEMTRRHPAS